MGCGSSTNDGALVVENNQTRRPQATREIVNQQTHGTEITPQNFLANNAQYHGETVAHQTAQRTINMQQQITPEVQMQGKEVGLTTLSESRRMVDMGGGHGEGHTQTEGRNVLLSKAQTNGRANIQPSTHEGKNIQQRSRQEGQSNKEKNNERNDWSLSQTKGLTITEGIQTNTNDNLLVINGTQVDRGQENKQNVDKDMHKHDPCKQEEQKNGDHRRIQGTLDIPEARDTTNTSEKQNSRRSDLLSNHREWKVEDTFWEGKKRVIKDYDRIRVVDQHAIDTPKSLKKDSRQLVSHLVSIARSDLEKYRVIFRWIAHHIDSDMGHINEEPQIGDGSPEVMLKNGIGQDFSILYSYLCRIACLECVNISGTSKGLGYDPGEDLGRVPDDGAWNHIRIEGEWFACECDWAAGHVERDEETGKYKYIRQWVEAWFLIDPKTSDASHLPLNDKDDIHIEALLFPRSYKNYEEWNDEPEKKPAYFTYKMQCISHKHAIIDAENNEIEIRLKCFYPMDIFTTMKRAKIGDVKPLHLPKDREFDRCVVRYFQGNEVVVVVRLPSQGDYIVGVCGYAYGISEEVQRASGNFIVGYRIRGLSSIPCSLFPERRGDIYGASWDLQLAGVQVIQPEEPIIESENGKATIELDRGDSGKSLIFGYYHESDPSKDLNEYMYPETVGKKVKLNIACPKEGMYSCVVYCKFDDEEQNNDTHKFGGEFVISCPKADPNVRAFPSNSSGLWGSDEFIHELGIKTSDSMTMSTIYTENGKGTIEFLVPKGVKTTHSLVDMKGENIGKSCLYAETTTQTDGSRKVNLQIKCPEIGYYRLVLFGSIESEAKNTFCGRWMVNCNAPYGGQLFPESSGLWGPNSHFNTLGIDIITPFSSTINTQEGEGQLTYRVPKGIATRHKLTDVKGQNVKSSSLYAETRAKSDGSREVTLRIRCPEVGYFRLVLFGDKESVSNYSYCGQWMVNCNAPYSGRLFPESSGLWGPNSHLNALGIEITTPCSSTINTQEGEGQLTFRVPRGIATRHKLTNAKGQDIKSTSLYAETRAKPDGSKEVTLRIRCPEVGYFRLDLFGDKESASSYSNCGQWMVICSTTFLGQLFPESTGLWGPTQHSQTLGLRVVSPTCSTIQTYEGEARLIIYLETRDFLANEFLHELFYDNKRVEKEKQSVYAMVNHHDTFVNITYNFKVTRKGYYKLKIWGDSEGTGSFMETGQWLLRCEVPFKEHGLWGQSFQFDKFSEEVTPTSHTLDTYKKKGRRIISCETPFEGELFPEIDDLWGPNNHFHKLGIEVVSPTSSTLETFEGHAKLILCIKSKVFYANTLSHDLFKDNDRVKNGERAVMAEVSYKQELVKITYNIKLSKMGYYHFRLWGNPKSINTDDEAGVWLIYCSQPCLQEALYPEHGDLWGPDNKFRELGLAVVDHDSSTLHAVDGECRLVISSPEQIYTAYDLKTTDGKELDLVSSNPNADSTSIEFTIRVPEAGYYSFDLYASKTPGSMPWVGKWLVEMCQSEE